MRNTTTTVVIAAAAVLAAMIVTRTPAQPEYGVGDGACCLPNGGCLSTSQSNCGALGGTYLGAFTTCAGSVCPSAPTVVAMSIGQDTIGCPSVGCTDAKYRVYRTWSDGQVDMTVFLLGQVEDCVIIETCGPVVLIPGTCPTDIDRDGDTGINDFLALLGGWGACGG